MMDDNTEPEARARKGRRKGRQKVLSEFSQRKTNRSFYLYFAPFNYSIWNMLHLHKASYLERKSSSEASNFEVARELFSFHIMIRATKTIPSNGEGGRRCETVEEERGGERPNA